MRGTFASGTSSTFASVLFAPPRLRSSEADGIIVGTSTDSEDEVADVEEVAVAAVEGANIVTSWDGGGGGADSGSLGWGAEEAVSEVLGTSGVIWPNTSVTTSLNMFLFSFPSPERPFACITSMRVASAANIVSVNRIGEDGETWEGGDDV